MTSLESIEKLRKWSRMGPMVCQDLLDIADEIEGEIAEKYMELPVDADGVPIRVGDYLHSDETGRDFPCRGYSLTLQGNKKRWAVECCYDAYSGTSEYVSAKSCRHVKPRTVEDVLRDCCNEWNQHCGEDWEQGVYAKFASELQMREGGA